MIKMDILPGLSIDAVYIIVQYQLLYQHHGRSDGDTWAMLSKIYNFHNLPTILIVLPKGLNTVE